VSEFEEKLDEAIQGCTISHELKLEQVQRKYTEANEEGRRVLFMQALLSASQGQQIEVEARSLLTQANEKIVELSNEVDSFNYRIEAYQSRLDYADRRFGYLKNAMIFYILIKVISFIF